MNGLGVFVCFIAFIIIIFMIVMIIKFNDRVDDLEQQKEQEKKQKEKLVEYHVDYLGIPEELHDNVFETTIAGRREVPWIYPQRGPEVIPQMVQRQMLQLCRIH